MPRVAAVGRVPVAGRVAIPQTQNRILDNRNLAGANWTQVSTTVVGGQSDPLGGVQATEITEVAAVSTHTIFCTTNVSIASVGIEEHWYCASVFLRPGTRNFGGIICDLSTASFTAFWNLTTGANTLLAVSGPIVEQAALPPDTFLDGWRRYSACWRFITPNPISAAFVMQVALSSDGLTSAYLGAGLTMRAFAPAFAFANRPGPVTDTTAGIITTPIRNEARGRVVP